MEQVHSNRVQAAGLHSHELLLPYRTRDPREVDLAADCVKALHSIHARASEERHRVCAEYLARWARGVARVWSEGQPSCHRAAAGQADEQRGSRWWWRWWWRILAPSPAVPALHCVALRRCTPVRPRPAARSSRRGAGRSEPTTQRTAGHVSDCGCQASRLHSLVN
eukprot:COSAG02_NODE_2259_length_9330_cov_25.813455_5_plen_166_part_00